MTLIATYAISLAILPHQELPFSSKLNMALQSLLFLISCFILKREPNRKQKFIFFNFVAFFSLSMLQVGHDFIGTAFFTELPYVGFFYFQYLSLAFVLLLSIAVVYLVIDLLFFEFKIYQKYLVTFVIVFTFFGILFSQFISNPLYLYSTEDIKQWKALDDEVRQLDEIPAATLLASKVTLQKWEDGKPVGDLYPNENLNRIEVLIPYLQNDSWMVLFYKPIYLNTIYMNVMLIGCILLFFGYQYKKDPPQGAYIDKIMFLLLLFSSMEILHHWGYIKSVEYGSMTELFDIGQYVTFLVEILMVLFFSLRLQFISSVQGEFYETELATNPAQVTRWRDWVDNIVLSHFFNFKVFNGRLFQGGPGRQN
jgi:hypothetical protein